MCIIWPLCFSSVEVGNSSRSQLSSSLKSDVGWPLELHDDPFALWPLLTPELFAELFPGEWWLLRCSVLQRRRCSSSSRMALCASAAWWAHLCSSWRHRWPASSNDICSCSRSWATNCILFSNSVLRLFSKLICGKTERMEKNVNEIGYKQIR